MKRCQIVQAVGLVVLAGAQLKAKENPMLDVLTRARLNWMFDNQPDIVKELLDKKRLPELEKSLDAVVIPAIQLKNDLLERGMSEPDAEL